MMQVPICSNWPWWDARHRGHDLWGFQSYHIWIHPHLLVLLALTLGFKLISMNNFPLLLLLALMVGLLCTWFLHLCLPFLLSSWPWHHQVVYLGLGIRLSSLLLLPFFCGKLSSFGVGFVRKCSLWVASRCDAGCTSQECRFSKSVCLIFNLWSSQFVF